jgi:hypothetical protein
MTSGDGGLTVVVGFVTGFEGSTAISFFLQAEKMKAAERNRKKKVFLADCIAFI